MKVVKKINPIISINIFIHLFPFEYSTEYTLNPFSK